MDLAYSRPPLVQKEIISGLYFSNGDVLKIQESISQRRTNAERGMLLGNNYKGKVRITFEDSKGMKQVETTIWSVTENYVLLKKGMTISLHRIHEIMI